MCVRQYTHTHTLNKWVTPAPIYSAIKSPERLICARCCLAPFYRRCVTMPQPPTPAAATSRTRVTMAGTSIRGALLALMVLITLTAALPLMPSATSPASTSTSSSGGGSSGGSQSVAPCDLPVIDSPVVAAAPSRTPTPTPGPPNRNSAVSSSSSSSRSTLPLWQLAQNVSLSAESAAAAASAAMALAGQAGASGGDMR